MYMYYSMSDDLMINMLWIEMKRLLHSVSKLQQNIKSRLNQRIYSIYPTWPILPTYPSINAAQVANSKVVHSYPQQWALLSPRSIQGPKQLLAKSYSAASYQLNLNLVFSAIQKRSQKVMTPFPEDKAQSKVHM